MVTIGLTIPTFALELIWLPGSLRLGLTATQIVLLALTVGPGRATRLHGGLHLTPMAALIFLAINP